MAKPSRAERLARSLDDAGYPEVAATDEMAALMRAATVESRSWQEQTCRGRTAAWLPLATRNLLSWFDAEGGYYEPGAHSRLLRCVLRPLGSLGDVADEWIDGKGWLLTAGDKRFFQPAQRASSYAEVGLVVLAASEIASAQGSPLRAHALRTGDQSAAIALMPAAVAALARSERLLGFEPIDDWNAPRALAPGDSARAP